jgi:hypothetical protein
MQSAYNYNMTKPISQTSKAIGKATRPPAARKPAAPEPKPGEYSTGTSPAMRRLTEARRALEDRRALRELGLL